MSSHSFTVEKLGQTLFSTEGAQQAYNSAGYWLDRIAGLVLALLGLWLASATIISNI